MAEESQGQEKTEEATPRKLEKAREEGQVSRSRELNSVAIVTFGAAAAIFVAPGLANTMMEMTMKLYTEAGQTQISMTTILGESILAALWAILPFSLVMFAAGVFSSIGVGGMLYSPKALQPKFERLSPIKGFGRMFSAKSLMELAKSLAKFVLVSGIAVLLLGVMLEELLQLGGLPLHVAVTEGVSRVGWALLVIGSALVVVAAIDVPFQMAQHKKQLKMTKQEVKEELKNSEGKPEVKARIRQLQQQAARRQMLEEVPNADVVITNPEHFSVAIKYDGALMAAPIMLAKGVDHMAFRIREVAGQHDIPLVAMPPLARAIYYNTEAGDEIPEELYVAVAQVLAYIYQLDQYRRGQLEGAPTLGDIEVPENLREGPDAFGGESEQ